MEGRSFLRGGDELRVSGHHRRAVAGHAAALGQGAEGERALTGYLEDRGRRITEVEVVVALVGEEKDVVRAAERGNLLQILVRRRRAGRVVGVVDPERPDVLRVQLFHPEQEPVPSFQPERHWFPAGEEGAPLVDRIAGRTVGDAAPLVRGVQEGQRSVEDRLFGAGRGQDLRLGVERDAIAPLHPAGEGLAQAPLALSARVLAHLGDAVYEGPSYLRVRRLARVAGAEVEELDALSLDLAPALLQAEQGVGAAPLQRGVQQERREGRAAEPAPALHGLVAPGSGTRYIPSTSLAGASNIALLKGPRSGERRR